MIRFQRAVPHGLVALSESLLRSDRERPKLFGKSGWNFIGQFAVVVCLASWTGADAYAGTVVAATGVTSPQGDYGAPYSLVNSITSSSGLSSSYIDGVTDFSTLVTTATYNGLGGATNTFTGLPQYFVFDLGSSRTIDAIGLWANMNPGDGSPTSFSLYAGTDNTGTQLLNTVSSTGGVANAPGQAFYFTPTTTQFVTFEVLAFDAPANYSPVIGQAVFEAPVPEADTYAMMLAGMGLVGFVVRRRKQAQA